jgi:hypothetical protein
VNRVFPFWILVALGCPLSGETAGLIQGTARSKLSGDPLFGAEVAIQNTGTGARWRLQTGEDGSFQQPGLRAGAYSVRVRMPGFRTATRGDLTLEAGHGADLEFHLEMIMLHEEITVVSGRDEVDPSGTDTLTFSRNNPGPAVPTNGRDYRSTFELAPGVLHTPATVNDGGQFSANGQRPNANTFLVDGISANTGIGGNALPGSFPGGSLPSMTAFGTTESLVTPDSTQSIEFRATSFAPEHGERPGALALISTRPGTSEFHGSVFAHMRDSSWSAQDWFYNGLGPLAYAQGIRDASFYRSWGGSVGGPLLRHLGYFFFSADDSSLVNWGYQRTSVPSTAVRQNAPSMLAGILSYFPSPVGRDLGAGQAEGMVSIGTSAWLRTINVRIDRTLGSKGTAFLRYVEAPSKSITGLVPNSGMLFARLFTGGLTTASAGFVHDARLNYTLSQGGPGYGYAFGREPIFGLAGLLPGFHVVDYGSGSWGWLWDGAAGNPLTSLLPSPSGNSLIGLSVGGLGQFLQGSAGSPRQDQWEFRDVVSRQHGNHQIRLGLNAVRRAPSRSQPIDSIRGAVSSLNALAAGESLALTVSQIPAFASKFYAGSLFAQDTVRLSDALSMVYGLRWEITPPSASPWATPTVSGIWRQGQWQTIREGDISAAANWPMRYAQLAPRLGLAYRLPWAGVVLRTGAGLFYDSALASVINPVSGAPFNSWELSAGGTGIGSAGSPVDTPPPGAGNAPDVESFLAGNYPSLHLPQSWQWRVALERSAGPGGVVSASYNGAAGRHLIGNQAYVDPSTGIMRRMVTLTENSSNYQALQTHYHGRLGSPLYLSASYTWSRSIDDASQDSAVFLIQPGYRLASGRANSSFDVRHALSASFAYRMPEHLPAALKEWTLSGVLRAHTGFPIDVLNGEPALGLRYVNSGRPDLVPNVPLWLNLPDAPGGRVLNPAAFSLPANGASGNLGRNAITGNGLVQLDLSLRRRFRLYRGWQAEAGINAFNATNTPAFADPVPYLSSPWFGQSTSMRNIMFGSGRPNGGLPPMFQMGGPRLMELNLRFSF